jgi:hypothetical protein
VQSKSRTTRRLLRFQATGSAPAPSRDSRHPARRLDLCRRTVEVCRPPAGADADGTVKRNKEDEGTRAVATGTGIYLWTRWARQCDMSTGRRASIGSCAGCSVHRARVRVRSLSRLYLFSCSYISGDSLWMAYGVISYFDRRTRSACRMLWAQAVNHALPELTLGTRSTRPRARASLLPLKPACREKVDARPVDSGIVLGRNSSGWDDVARRTSSSSSCGALNKTGPPPPASRERESRRELSAGALLGVSGPSPSSVPEVPARCWLGAGKERQVG